VSTPRPRRDLGTPRKSARVRTPHYDPEAFGRFSEAIARTFGTARFLFVQTMIVAGWIAANVWLLHNRGFDPYPFILLNLAFSTQAAYAAPLILLAQNRQEERDRASTEADRRANARAQASTEYLARELAEIRLKVGEMPSRDYLDDQLDRLQKEIESLRDALGSEARDIGRD
jgi:uncharacterized membrane protein